MAEIVAEPFVSFVVEKACELLFQEAKFLKGVKGQVEEMERELKQMQCFLQDAEKRRQEGDATVGNWVAQVREISYDVEDAVATYVAKVALKRRDGSWYVLIKRYLCIFKECGNLHAVGTEIRDINNKISRLTRSLQTYGLQQQSSNSRFESQLQERRRSYPHDVEEVIVGLDNDVKEVVDLLAKGKSDSRVISICGLGGLGKTTLAKLVYNHQDIRRYFDSVAWAYISQECNIRDVWEGILIKLMSARGEERKEIGNLKNDELAARLYDVQSQKKCLVILDDIWHNETWNRLRPGFGNTSKILLTTRRKDVGFHIDPQCHLYELRFLTEEESWDLFEKKAFLRTAAGTELELNEEKIRIGREMVKHCGGLPLAIAVLGGLLGAKQSVNEWESVRKNIGYHLSQSEAQGGVAVKDILALSYQDLPHHLKACFLYLSHLPEDCHVRVEKLIQMWMAERFVSLTREPEDQETLMDVGMSYLGDLIQRSMVQVQLTRFGRRIKLCRLHDLMRDLCLLKAQEENFLTVVRLNPLQAFCQHPLLKDGHSASSSSSLSRTTLRRLALHYSDDHPMLGSTSGYVDPRSGLKITNHHHVRSCLVQYNGQEEISWSQLILLCQGFKLLKVLDIEGDGKLDSTLVGKIGRLVDLRYLSLRNRWIDVFPSSLGELIFLQTLDLRGCSGIKLSNVFRGMEQLRHLYLPGDVAKESSCSGVLVLDGLSKLETLVNFDTGFFDVGCLSKLPNLRKVVMKCKPNDLAKMFECPIISDSNSLLKYSSFAIFGEFQDQEDYGYLWQLFGCHHLHDLTSDGNLNLVKLPNDLNSNISKLYIWDCNIKEDPMPTLGKLPNLRNLTLHFRAYKEEEMVCCALAPAASFNSCSGSFPQLRCLFLCNSNLEYWKVEEGAMRCLSSLVIFDCIKLREIPDGLRYITTLEELEFLDVSESLRARVDHGGEDYYKIQHVPSIKIATI